MLRDWQANRFRTCTGLVYVELPYALGKLSITLSRLALHRTHGRAGAPTNVCPRSRCRPAVQQVTPAQLPSLAQKVLGDQPQRHPDSAVTVNSQPFAFFIPLESIPRSMLPNIDSGAVRFLNCIFAFMSGVGLSFRVLSQGCRICSA